MQIDDHAFDRMTLRLEDDERKQIIEKIESVWNRVQDCLKKDVGVIAMRISDIRMTDNSGYESMGMAKGCIEYCEFPLFIIYSLRRKGLQ